MTVIKVTASTMGQQNPSLVTGRKPYRWHGIPGWEPGDPRYREEAASGPAVIKADKAARLAEFAGYLAQGLTAQQAGKLVGVAPKTARAYERELRCQRAAAVTRPQTPPDCAGSRPPAPPADGRSPVVAVAGIPGMPCPHPPGAGEGGTSASRPGRESEPGTGDQPGNAGQGGSRAARRDAGKPGRDSRSPSRPGRDSGEDLAATERAAQRKDWKAAQSAWNAAKRRGRTRRAPKATGPGMIRRMPPGGGGDAT